MDLKDLANAVSITMDSFLEAQQAVRETEHNFTVALAALKAELLHQGKTEFDLEGLQPSQLIKMAMNL